MAETKCPVCGKTFDRTEEWVYKHSQTKYCSWSCMRKDESEDKRHANSSKAKHLYNLTGEGAHSLSEWSRMTGIPYSTLYKRIKQHLAPEQVLEGAIWKGEQQ